MNAAGERLVYKLVKRLDEFNNVTRELLRDIAAFYRVRIRTYFGTLLENYLTLLNHLDSHPKVMYDLHFELAIFKIQDGLEDLLRIVEKKQIF